MHVKNPEITVAGDASCERLDFRAPPAGDDAGPSLGDHALWITWERQRRTIELSRALGLRLFLCTHRGSRLARYRDLIRMTAGLLRRERPRVLVVQNPSMILAAVVAFLKPFLRFKLVVDRHTNFMINQPRTLKIRLLGLISDYSLRRSDLTIVTNPPLAELVRSKGSPSFVLPDRIPTPPSVEPADLGPGRHVAFICTYADDEPYNEVIGLAPSLPPDVTVHITGRRRNAALTPESERILAEHGNVVLTDYLSEEDYWRLLAGADAIMDLTTLDHCLVCGAYEALSLDKPLVLSDKQANRDLFGDAPVLVGAGTPDILAGLSTILAELPDRREAATALHRDFADRWDRDFDRLRQTLRTMARNGQGD